MQANLFFKRTLWCGLLLAWGGVASAQRVNNAEYFWDTDPGAGNGTSMTAADGAFDAALEAILLQTGSLPSVGSHKLGMRVQDQQNNWGPTFSTVVMIDAAVATAPEIKVTQAEFYWDTDPGEGSGTPMVAFDGNFDAAWEAITLETNSLPATGTHVLHMRTMDVNDVWGAPFSVVVEVMDGVVTFPEIHVRAAEYYVNTDPGEGNGTPMLAVDGNFDSALEAIKGGGIPVPVIAGVNVLWMRSKDVNDNWGPAFGIVVNIDTTATGTTGVETAGKTNGPRLAPNPVHGGDAVEVIL
ncbi:MAG TPA: hypothetical protein PK760_10380, partial [Flavobacteriales bacterium]|nr:hypothetical protein [Flavobacteriales bacterium]